MKILQLLGALQIVWLVLFVLTTWAGFFVLLWFVFVVFFFGGVVPAAMRFLFDVFDPPDPLAEKLAEIKREERAIQAENDKEEANKRFNENLARSDEIDRRARELQKGYVRRR